MPRKLKFTLKSILAAFLCWRIWLLLAWQDIRLRYRRSQLGPFWLTLSMAVTTYSMGFLYGHLFKVDLEHYFPFLASGMLTWAFISTTINDSTNAFVDAAHYLKQVKLPSLIFVLRVVSRNLIIFFHNIVAVIPVMIYCHVPFGWHTFSLLWGLIIIFLTGFVYGTILAIIGARFRDIVQVVASLIQVIFFLTPIMWMPEALPGRYYFAVKFNPFAQFIDLVRFGLIGKWPTLYDYQVTLGVLLLGIILMIFLFRRVRHRIIYWL
jgi:lipopolysaccharide transport system permease protein